MSRNNGDIVIKIQLNTTKDVRDFVFTTSKYKFSVKVQSGKYCVDGKSILGILSLNLSDPIDVVIDTGLLSKYNVIDGDKYMKEIKKWRV